MPKALFHTLAVWLLTGAAHAADDYTLVLSGGRVIDPETGLDDIRHVGLAGDRIVRISEEALTGAEVVDVSGLVVAPGFIDLHSHTPTPLGQRYQAHDGVTTALELEAGAYPVDGFGYHLAAGSVLNYGASAGYGAMRVELMHGIRQSHIIDPAEPVGLRGWWTQVREWFGDVTTANTKVATEDERARLREMLEAGIDQGGIGIGLPLDYYSEAIDDAEVRAIFEVAAQRQAPIFVHVRRGINGDPAGLREVLDLARETGASVHVCHITHNAMVSIELFLREIRDAQSAGVDVTTELLPYMAGSTFIGAAVFGRDWRTIFNIDYGDVEWAATGERFDEAMFNEYRQKYPDGGVIHHYLDEDWNRRAVVEPGLIIVSDLLPMFSEEVKVAPHNGAFSRVLGRYVRKESLLSLQTALAKMTLLPARRIEQAAPAFKRKGRLQEGMDADITVFDPLAVEDRATYQDPYQTSAGIRHVIVNGVFVVRDEQFVDNTYPGRRIDGEL
ncbi:MAG: amidohydrolase family protein [Pseudomonadales bacterium]|nr:amidohydrolase family protein [Pseudomonadales bacterium]NIX09662.1 amidohydrolase family protein [Pseudomonadales bacterium]